MRAIDGKQWVRVSGSDIDTGRQKRYERNMRTMKDEAFITACGKVGIVVTKRQASKWNNKRGLVYEFMKGNKK